MKIIVSGVPKKAKKLVVKNFDFGNKVEINIKSFYKKETCIVLHDGGTTVYNVFLLSYLGRGKIFIPKNEIIKNSIIISRFL